MSDERYIKEEVRAMKIPAGTHVQIKGPDGAYMAHETSREVNAHWVSSEPEDGWYVALVTDSGQEWTLLVPEDAINPTAKVKSLTVPGQFYLIAFDASGQGIRCSCPGFSNRRKCRHLRSSAMQALWASMTIMLDAGASFEDIWSHWKSAEQETSHLGARCARMAYKASEIVGQQQDLLTDDSDRLAKLADDNPDYELVEGSHWRKRETEIVPADRLVTLSGPRRDK